MTTLIQNGTLVLPDGEQRADLRIAHGKIAQIGPGLVPGDEQVVDAGGKLVFPGFIDTHTHFEMNKGLVNETADDWVSGTRAAVVGGTTCVLDFAETQRGARLETAAETWHGRADGRASCHYGFHMTIKDWDETVPGQIGDMAAAGITSYKVYLAYDNLKVTDGVAYEVVKAVGRQGGIVGCHCENGDLVNKGIAAMKAAGRLGPEAHPWSRPPYVEAEAVDRWLTIAEAAGYPVNIVHLSSLRGLEVVRAARARGQKFYVESCPQYFLLDDEKYKLPGFASAKFVLSPPLRGRDSVEGLWDALQKGEVDTMGTDHCSFHFQGVKELGREDFAKIPNGMPGVEHRVPLMYSAAVAGGSLSNLEFMKILAEQPAKLFGMYPRKGCLAVGSDADLTLLDPDRVWTVTAKEQTQRADYTPYEGVEVKGKVDQVYLCGQRVVEGGRLVLEHRGQYVHRGPSELWR